MNKFFGDKNIYSYLKAFLVFLALLAVSWVLAIFWSAHGDWWINLQPDFSRKVTYVIAKPFLSSDVAQAEDQLDFWQFWIPSLVLVTVFFLLLAFARKRAQQKHDKQERSSGT